MTHTIYSDIHQFADDSNPFADIKWSYVNCGNPKPIFAIIVSIGWPVESEIDDTKYICASLKKPAHASIWSHIFKQHNCTAEIVKSKVWD